MGLGGGGGRAMRVRGATIRFGACGGIALVAGACSNPGADYGQGADDICLSGWASDEHGRVPPRVYCYRTLADSDCHAAPLRDGAARLVGYEGLPPTETYPAQ